MKIKDIVNRNIVNLTNCEQEPIHVPGSIQTHGFLMAMRADTLKIDYCSANIKDFIDATHEQCLGKTLPEVFGAATKDAFLKSANRKTGKVDPPLKIEILGKTLLCTAHAGNDLIIAEFEPVDETVTDVTDVYDQTIRFVGYMEQSDTLRELCQKVAEQTRAITGYDRVMVYRFDKNYNGEVFAESKVDNIEPFLGLHYPHTDIPVQARQLYLTNLTRIIVNVNDAPVPLYTIDDEAHKTLDLGKSYLRSVSPIHIQYLKNMGVGGTFTISLIHDERLWGLITCHHYSAKYVPLYARIAAQMQGHFLTSQINVRQLNEEYKISAEFNTALEQLLDAMPEPTPDSFKDIIGRRQLQDLCGASGVAILFEGDIYKTGKTPREKDIKLLADWLKFYTKHGAFNTSKLVDVYPDGSAFSAMGSGVIYHSLSGLQNDAILWFAPETKEEVNWAGNPDEAILHTEKGLSPRNSFQLWKRMTRYESKDWRKPGIVAAANFAHALQKHITLILISEEEKKQRQLTEKLQEANTELENINWISSHDLKEPLRKIQIFSSKILDKEAVALSDMTILSLQKVIGSAGKMQQLLTDITAYNKVRHLHGAFERTDLTSVMADVTSEIADELQDANAKISYDKLPVVIGVPFLLRQLFVNLLRNSMKFTKEGVPLEAGITVAGEPISFPEKEPRLFYRVDVADNGIGFDNNHSESIFKVFTRLHSGNKYEGSGVGLALCRKIMQNHDGFITASGDPGNGAVFSLYFPVPE